ncbi:AAA family ATPase, partial [Actinoalloteichus spitiensis]|uniref:AAA family ATPase n=1 Tax=Actinoalloteichus spitiensis TaxID=252394 RepID=UPI0005844A3B
GGFSLGMSQRLGIAAALLGDPEILMFDEPVNGLDPEGIRWIRDFMRDLAAQGRTVFVSSHLLSEMAQTAEDLVVIGRGKLISQCTTAEFIDNASESLVRVRTPQPEELRAALARADAEVRVEAGTGALLVSGVSSQLVGEVAAASAVVLHELAVERASLEQAFMRLTDDAVEYQTTAVPTPELVTAGR